MSNKADEYLKDTEKALMDSELLGYIINHKRIIAFFNIILELGKLRVR